MNFPFCFWFFNFLYPCQESEHYKKSELYFHETDKCECGIANTIAPRIVGGAETLPNEFPWMAALLYEGALHCGGSLINDRYILTAGHCLKWAKKEKLTVVLGMHDKVIFEKRGWGGKSEPIEEIIMHEKFTSLQKFDVEDIALIKLKNSVFFTQSVAPVCLPMYPDETYAAQMAQVTGWGMVGQKDGPSRYLKEASLFVLSNEDCKRAPLVGKYITDIMMCAYMDETDACQGDSGGPLTYTRETGQAEQIGVVSWGIGCAKPEVPGVYARVTKYLKWIASKTQDAVYCKNRL